jgi:hypothetical protein
MEYTGWCENDCKSPGLHAPQVPQWKKSSDRPLRQMPHASQWNIPVVPKVKFMGMAQNLAQLQA